MELRVLRYFLAVEREENISRVAERLYVTQPTLSRQMAQLEEELGAQLFVRGKRLVLTDAGRMLPEVSQRTLTAQLRALEDDGVIERQVYAEVPPKVEYRLSAYGQTLRLVIMALKTWGDAHKRRLAETSETSEMPGKGRLKG